MRTIIGTNEKGENIYHPEDFFLSTTQQTTQSLIQELQPKTFDVLTNKSDNEVLTELIKLTGDTYQYDEDVDDELIKYFPIFFPRISEILVPKKVQTNLERHVSKELLRKIDPNINTAIEKCLLVLSNLSSTYYFGDKWKSLQSVFLHEQTKKPKDNTYIYTAVLEVLKTGTNKTGPIIEVKTNKNGVETYLEGSFSKQYRLTECYLKCGLTTYTLKNEYILQQRNKIFYRQLKESNNNIICKNLIDIYPDVDLPSIEELMTEARKLVDSGYMTKKGKKLTFLNRHKKEYYKNFENRSFVEDNIALFKFLTDRGFMIPVPGQSNSGGRVTDSFTLMPNWIRNMIKINGVALSECDFSAFHPNIAANLYGGKFEYLTHAKVAEETGIDIKEVKIEHLSFYNKPWTQMFDSPLFNYYSLKEPTMIESLFYEKNNKDNKDAYKITFGRMAGKEVEIMTAVIKELNSKGIYVLYIYDALMCKIQDRPVVLETMNRIVLEHGVKTIAK